MPRRPSGRQNKHHDKEAFIILNVIPPSFPKLKSTRVKRVSAGSEIIFKSGDDVAFCSLESIDFLSCICIDTLSTSFIDCVEHKFILTLLINSAFLGGEKINELKYQSSQLFLFHAN